MFKKEDLFVKENGWKLSLESPRLNFMHLFNLAFKVPIRLKVHKRENFFNSDFEFFTSFAIQHV